MEPLINIVFENQDLLVVNKPAGLVCHPTKGDALSSLISRLRLYFNGAVQPQLVNRLDRETSGLVLVAKNQKTARELGMIFESRKVEKVYEAIVHGWMTQERGIIDAPLGRDDSSVVAIKNCVRSDGAESRTEFRVLRHFERPEGRFTHLEVKPQTGRKHQIRIHLAYAGHPIVGDKLYGPDETYYLSFVTYALTEEQRSKLLLPFQALHSSTIEFEWMGTGYRYKTFAEGWFKDFLGSV